MTLNKVWKIRGPVIAVGILFLVIGISRGEPAIVMMKAVRICLECIGIG